MRRPADSRGWLCKRAGAAGGGHVRTAAGRAPSGRGWYWQRRAAGRPVSALVLGAAGSVRVLGCSEQWSAPMPGRRFRFAGAAAPSRLSGLARERLEAAATALSRHFGLIGLCSVDALVDGDTVTVLEVNPRPGAALDAAAGALGLNLFKAPCGGLPAWRRHRHRPPPVGTAGSLIVYAERPTVVPSDSSGRPGPPTAARPAPGSRVTAQSAPCWPGAATSPPSAISWQVGPATFAAGWMTLVISAARHLMPGSEAQLPAEQR